LSVKKIVIALAAVVVGGAVAFGVFKSRKAEAGKAPAAAASAPAIKPLELLEQDLVRVTPAAFERTLPVSGSLRAARTALLKSKLSGDVFDLTVREGEVVAKGQVIARIDDSEFRTRVTQAKNTYLANVAQVSIAERQFASNQALVNQEFISKTALDTSLNNLQAARANRDAAKAALDLVEKSLTDAMLRSPIAGTISQRFVQNGEKVSPDARIVEVVDLASLELEAAVPSNEIAAIKVGQVAQISADGASEAYAAKVARINPSTQGASRTIGVYLQLDKAQGLRNGMFMQGQIVTQSIAGALSIPLSAVRLDKPQPYVFVVQNNVIAAIDVGLGARSAKGGETTVEVLKGLTDGMRVVRGNIGGLALGTAIKVSTLK
jgi:RND family efflux transporter MFP subunit